MASVSRLSGLRPVKHISGGSYTGQSGVYFVPASDATVIMVGDVVKLAGSAGAVGVPTVTRHAGGATEPAVGVVVGILFTGVGDAQNIPPVTDLNTPVYRRASTDRYLLVADDPGLIFEAQASASGSFTAVDVGLNAGVRATAGSTTSGASGMDIDLGAKATTATLPLKIVGFPNRPDNNIGDAFINLYVRINNHQFNSGTGSLGV